MALKDLVLERPTPAEIEAAENAIELLWSTKRFKNASIEHMFRDLAIAALNAAALARDPRAK